MTVNPLGTVVVVVKEMCIIARKNRFKIFNATNDCNKTSRQLIVDVAYLNTSGFKGTQRQHHI